MDILGRNSLKRQQAVVAALRITAAPVAATGPAQPHDPAHPGSDVYPYPEFTVGTYRIWHAKWFAVYPTNVTYLIPVGPVPLNSFPVVAVSPGKFLDQMDFYAQLLRHICRKGYVVLFVDADTGPLDCEHKRMAGEFLQGVYQTLTRKIGGRTSSPAQLLWWGHSMGAKVQAIAAAMTTQRYFLRPTAIIANNFSNDKGQFCNDDALQTAASIPGDIWYTSIEGDRDDISKEDPRRLYDALEHLAHRQLITVVSYPEDGLIANHEAPLTGSVLSSKAVLNALDWWLYWKIVVGAGNFHFKSESDKWAYGSERENGGTDSAGRQLKHRVENEG